MIKWLDVSEVIDWNDGNCTGIERVILNSAQYLANKDQNFRLFTFNIQKKLFFEVDSQSFENATFSKFKVFENRALTFNETDKLIHLGISWLVPEMIEVLYDLKNKRGFTTYHLIHDLIPMLTPQYHSFNTIGPFTRWFEKMYKYADHFLCNSLFTKNELYKYLDQRNFAHKNADVIRFGDQHLVKVHSKGLGNMPLDQDFILNVGTLEPRKNHSILYQVWKMLTNSSNTSGTSTPILIIVGKQGWLTGDIQHLMRQDPQVKDKIIFLNDISDVQLSWLYQNCLFTLYPSFYEGWGLPVAESLANEKYCITTKDSAMCEIAGDLIDYHNPHNSHECFSLVQKAITDPAYLKDKEKRIKKHYKITSWESTAKTINKIVEKNTYGIRKQSRSPIQSHP